MLFLDRSPKQSEKIICYNFLKCKIFDIIRAHFNVPKNYFFEIFCATETTTLQLCHLVSNQDFFWSLLAGVFFPITQLLPKSHFLGFERQSKSFMYEVCTSCCKELILSTCA